jgi:hypothetical protein
VKSRGVGDGLNEVRIGGVSIGSGNRRMLTDRQRGDGWSDNAPGSGLGSLTVNVSLPKPGRESGT